ncbi:hypothetical protein [Rhizobium sp. PP-CC-3G-465]|uniref:hypothetical protein n=1 Tax=Rhizobium sp. PP-CC-3G-465 TaxID=2135648 RepID=UPI001044E87C|nr:hypothetical protein C8J33_12410 [Rhizobium sp. PP-CC-3G-465]
MPAYRDFDGDSGVIFYRYGGDWIEVEFQSGIQRYYTYTYSSAGAGHVDQMKRLADAGDGLNSYINKNVAKRYAAKR